MLKEDNFYDAVSQVWKLLEELAITTEYNFNSTYNLFARFRVVIMSKKKVHISSLHTHLLLTATKIIPLPNYRIQLHCILNWITQFLFARLSCIIHSWTYMIPFLSFPGCVNDKLQYNLNIF